MRKAKKFVSFTICFALIAAIAVAAYAIAFTANDYVRLRIGAGPEFKALGQFSPGEIFWVQGGARGTDDATWFYGNPDQNTALYRAGHTFGYAHSGYFDVTTQP